MGKITLEIKYGKNEALVLSPEEIRERYMWGVSVKDQSGEEIPDSVIEGFIRSAQEQLTNMLQIKLQKQVINESQDFKRTDWVRWGYVACTYPVICPIGLSGFLNSVKQISYPQSWLSVRTINSDGQLYHKNLYVVPVGDSTGHAEAVVYSGIVPQLGITSSDYIPNYWDVTYVTGFDRVPKDIIEVIGKTAAINVFHIAGDLILGAGIASFSLGLDGLSQSISTTSSATNAGYGARITGYLNDLKRDIPILKDYYRGFSFGVV